MKKSDADADADAKVRALMLERAQMEIVRIISVSLNDSILNQEDVVKSDEFLTTLLASKPNLDFDMIANRVNDYINNIVLETKTNTNKSVLDVFKLTMNNLLKTSGRTITAKITLDDVKLYIAAKMAQVTPPTSALPRPIV